jgi:hypothetical protein
VSWLKRDPSSTARWRSSDGPTTETIDLPLHLDVTTNPGLSIHPVTLTAPHTPGRYQLTLDASDVLDPLVQTIDVRPTAAVKPTAPPFGLRTLTWDKPAYQPGDWIEVQAEWAVNRAFDRPLTATLQLQSSDGRTLGQWDGPPFGDALPIDQWQPGATIVQPMLIQIPPNAGPGPLHLMLALYDHNTPDLARQTITLPNGERAAQFESDAISITR